MIANIDADVLCYSVGSYQNDHPVLKNVDGTPLKMPVPAEYIQQRVDEKILEIQEEAGCDSSVCFLSGKYNFRTDVAVTFPYKGKRDGADKPYHHKTVYDYIASLDSTVITEGREADDGLADAQTNDTVLCTIDKDLDMVTGLHYNWNKKEEGVYEVDFLTGYKWFCKQLLTGDWTTDAILGCAKLVDKVYGPKAAKAGQQYTRREGIGPKEADEILKLSTTPIGWLDAVADTYKQMFGDQWEDKIDEMGTLLWMGGSADNLWTYKKALTFLTKETNNEEA